MLQTLRKHDPIEVQRILSSLTSELLPDPEVSVHAGEFSVDPNLYSEIWKEIRRRVKVDPSDTSPEMRGKVFEFLFTEMSQIILTRSTIDSVKSRLGRIGELRSDLYDVQFARSFRVSRAHGVRRNHVLEAITKANDVEHVDAVDGEVLMSFFLRTHMDFPSADPFALLVIALRVGHKLDVSSALRIYRSDVDFTAAQRPSDVLRLIVGKYGFTITIGHITSKLILNQTTTIEPPIDSKTIMKINALEGISVIADCTVRPRRLHNSFGIALAFALDQSKYAHDLRKHGVHVEGEDFRVPAMSMLTD